MGSDWGEPVRLPGSGQSASAASGVSFGDRIIVASTVFTGETPTIGIWSSADGIGWSLETPNELAGTRAIRLIVGPTGLVLAGLASTSRVLTPSSTIRAAMWTSPDGRAWTDVAAGPEFDRGRITDIASSGSKLLAIGHHPATTPAEETCPIAMVWRSTDGATWEVVEGPEPCSRVSSVSPRDGKFVVLGQVPGGDGPAAWAPGKDAAWLLDGGWEALLDVPPSGATYKLMDGPAVSIAVATSRQGPQSTAPDVLASTDGRSWSVAAEDAFQAPRDQPLTVTPLGYAGAFFVSRLSANADGHLQTVVWRSEDGRTWTQLPESSALNRAPPITSVVLHGDDVIGLGGRTNIVAWVSPPSPLGPGVPELAEPDVVEAAIPGSGTPRAVVFDGDAALAVGTELDVASATVSGRVWRWAPGSGWEPLVATGLDGAELSGIAHGPGGYVAIGQVRRQLGNDQGVSIDAHAWTSADGRSWTASPLDLGSTVVGLRPTGIVAGGPGYVVVAVGVSTDAECTGGRSQASVALTSADGRTWTPAEDPDLACAQVSAVAEQDGRLVAVGGTARIVTLGPTPGPSPSPCGQDVCLGGTAYEEMRAAAWASTNGVEWTPSGGLDALGWGRVGLTSVAAGPGGYVGTWSRDSVLVSRDGLSWTQAYIPIGQSVDGVDLVRGTSDGYLALGTLRGRDLPRFTMFVSIDGRTWQEVAASAWAPEPGTFVGAMDGADGAGFLVVGTKSGQPAASRSWQVAAPGS